MLRKTVVKDFAPPPGRITQQQRGRRETKSSLAGRTTKSVATNSTIVDFVAAFSVDRLWDYTPFDAAFRFAVTETGITSLYFCAPTRRFLSPWTKKKRCLAAMPSR
jgi:hypothetical protein